MNVIFRKTLALFIIGIALIFAGCGTTVTSSEDEKYESVTKDEASETNSNEIVKDDVVKDVKEEKTPVVIKPQAPVKAIPKEGTTDQIPVTLVSTTDGDTIRVMYKGVNEPVRYLLIDTPETNHPRLGKQPFGTEAKERNRELVNSGNLTLEFDVGEKRDKYGRLLAYVYVDGKSVQEALIRDGLARVGYIYPPNTRHLTPYEEVQKVAKSKKLGFWAVEDYASDSGFASTPTASSESNSTDGGSSSATSTPSAPAATSGTTEWFDNCTHLRTKYPSGVASDHPAYQSKMDRDKDNFACEK
ncbi:MAG: thermonuclease family protein [Paenisporosarcina sp.]|nr:thermonuclease family protein [Paenisporosarcina sp.]